MGILAAPEANKGITGKIGKIKVGIPANETGKLTPREVKKIKIIIGKIGPAEEEIIRRASNALKRPI